MIAEFDQDDEETVIHSKVPIIEGYDESIIEQEKKAFLAKLMSYLGVKH